MTVTRAGSRGRRVLFAGALLAAALARPAIAGEPMLDGVKRILFYGDSLTDGSSYPDYVVNTLRALRADAPLAVLNAGGAGDTAADLVRRLDADVLAVRPDLVVLAIGTNDNWRRRPVADFAADYATLLDRMGAAGIRVLPVLPSPFAKPEDDARFAAYLDAIRAAAAARGLPVADAHGQFHAWLRDGREVLGADGVHHGPEGFACKAVAVLAALGYPDAALVTDVVPWPGLLLAWETSAPVPRKPPYDPADARDWTPHDRDAVRATLPWHDADFPARGAWLPFGGPRNDVAAFGRSVFDAPHAGTWELQVGGSPTPLVVWLNGAKVFESRRPHGYHPNADRVRVDLRAGRNELIVVSSFMAFVGLYPVEEEGSL